LFKDLEKILATGATPEKIYQEALRIEEAKKAAETKVKEARNAEVRKELLAAIANYVEAVTEKPIDKDFLKDTEDLLKEIEKGAMKISLKKEGNPPEKKKCDCKCKSQKTDDEKLIEFLKIIGAML
jgi:hypothetical protein